ncbi:Bombyxin C-1 [Papilio xuthus]|uniref:Bombyxin C-1 n=1 Tax=Papilio xuthus TaxID=66420 RepID=A0A194Q7C8_PAPXU|nr:Bombyxin C-1 [Papilio xuthus]
MSMQDIRDIKPQKYCGPVLSKALALLCYLDNEKVGKRANHNSIYNAILPPLYKEDVPSWPWLSVEKARSMGLASRGKRYVVDECCFKACSIDELMSYC